MLIRHRCSSGKVVYRTRIGAWLKLRELKQKGRHERRVYKCNLCDQWHLTSQKKRS